MIETGTRFDDNGELEILVHLSESGGGDVFFAQRTDTSDYCILKTDKAKNVSIDKSILKSEAQHLSLIGKYISIQLIDSIWQHTDDIVEGERPWILTDYLPGTNLGNLLFKVKTEIPPVIIFKIAIGTAFYINSIHNASVIDGKELIHRDIKPDNIFLDHYLEPHLGDFGDAADSNRSVTVNYHGTPGFAAPELMDGQYSKKCDVYSFGGVLYQMITREQLSGIPEKFQDIVADIKSNKKFLKIDEGEYLFKDLIIKCMSTEPNDRPTMEEIMNEITIVASKHLDSEAYDSFESYVNDLNLNEGQIFGTSENVDEAIAKGFDCLESTLRAVSGRTRNEAEKHFNEFLENQY